MFGFGVQVFLGAWVLGPQIKNTLDEFRARKGGGEGGENGRGREQLTSHNLILQCTGSKMLRDQSQLTS